MTTGSLLEVNFGLLELLAFLVVVGLVVGAMALSWDRYRGRPGAVPSPHLQPTTEVFIDPETGRKQRVWYDPTTGVRDYRDDA